MDFIRNTTTLRYNPYPTPRQILLKSIQTEIALDPGNLPVPSNDASYASPGDALLLTKQDATSNEAVLAQTPLEQLPESGISQTGSTPPATPPATTTLVPSPTPPDSTSTLIGRGSFHTVHHLADGQVIKILEDSILKRPSKVLAGPGHKQKIKTREQWLYLLAQRAGIPTAKTAWDEDLNTIQEICRALTDDNLRLKAISGIVNQIALLWSKGIFVLFDPSTDNVMLNSEHQFVMTDFGAERDACDFEDGEELAINFYSILKRWNLPKSDLDALLTSVLVTLSGEHGIPSTPDINDCVDLYKSHIRNSYTTRIEKALTDIATYRSGIIAQLKIYLK